MARARPRGDVAVLLAGVAAQVSVATVGAMPWLLLPVSAGAYVGVRDLASRLSGRQADVLRWSGTVLALLGLVVFGSRVVGTADRTEIKQALGLMLVTAQIGQAMGWRQVRDLRSALAASLGLLVLSSSYSPDVLIGLPLLVGWTAIVVGLALVAGLGRLEAVRAAAVAVVLGLVGFLLIPVHPTQGARNRLAALAAGSEGSRLPTDAFGSKELDLRRRGSLSTAGVLRVPLGAPPLWRGATFPFYDGTSWRRDVTGTRLLGDGPTYTVSVAHGPTRTDVVQRVGESSGGDATVWAPGPITMVRATGGFGAIADDQGGMQLHTPTYEVTTEELNSGAGSDPLDPRWRELPVTLPSRVGDLARQLAAGSRVETAQAMARYLREHATYRLDSPVPLPGQDAVDRFLFVDRTGFCEQFASAEVVMLRSLGIPARLVTGLAYGVRDGDMTLLRVSDLHAWVELWLPGAGWVSSDPTAGAQLADGTVASIRRRLAATMSRLLRDLTRVPGGRPALAVGLLLIALLASTLLTRRIRPPRASRSARAPGPALEAFLRLDARLGSRRRREAESLRELGQRLDASVAEALRVVERECYGPRQPEPAEVRAAVAVLDRATAPDVPAPRARRGLLVGRGRRPRRG